MNRQVVITHDDVPAGSKKLVLDTRNTLATLVQYFAVEYG